MRPVLVVSRRPTARERPERARATTLSVDVDGPTTHDTTLGMHKTGRALSDATRIVARGPPSGQSGVRVRGLRRRFGHGGGLADTRPVTTGRRRPDCQAVGSAGRDHQADLASQPAPLIHHRRRRRRSRIARRPGSSQPCRPAHNHALRPRPSIPGPSRDLRRRRLPRWRRPPSLTPALTAGGHGRRAPDTQVVGELSVVETGFGRRVSGDPGVPHSVGAVWDRGGLPGA